MLAFRAGVERHMAARRTDVALKSCVVAAALTLTSGIALFACGTSHNSGWSNGGSEPGGGGGTSGSGGPAGGGPLGNGTPGGGNGLALGGYDASTPGSSGGGGSGGTTGGANQPLTPAMGSVTASDCSGCSFPPANA